MKRIFVILLLVSTVDLSCVSDPSGDEKVANKLLEQWGGEMKFGVLSTLNAEGRNKDFAITLKESSLIDKGEVKIEQVASNIALAFYKSWNTEKREKYDRVICKIIDKQSGDEATTELKYELAQLQKAVDGEQYFHYCTDQIKENNYSQLADRFDRSVYSFISRDKLLFKIDSSCRALKEKYGAVVSDSVIGFSFHEDSLNKLLYSGVLQFDKGKSPVTIVVINGRSINEPFLYYLTFRE